MKENEFTLHPAHLLLDTRIVMNIHSVFEVFGRATERLTAVVALEREGIKKGNSDRVAAYIYRRWDE